MRKYWWLWLILAIVVIVAVSNTNYSSSKPAHSKVASIKKTHPHAPSASLKKAHPYTPSASVPHPGCSGAFFLESRAVRENKSGQYEAAYEDSAYGLARAQSCSDNERIAAEAFLLSAGAFAEHYLGRDKDGADMNLALQKLEQCITTNYGESLGAECQSEQEIEIRNKTNWETDQ